MSEQSRAADLRRSFDETFTRPPASRSEDTEDLLAVRVGGDAYAIRLRDIDGVVTGRKVVPVPGRNADCLGVAGIRGSPVPVFDLARMLGYGASEETPRWMVLSGRDEPVALAFAAFEGYLRLPRSSIQARDASGGLRATELVHTPEGVRSVVSVAALVSTIRTRAGRSQPGKEQG